MSDMPMPDDAYALVRKLEGGYANNPADPGGATNFGVTQKRYDAYRLLQGEPQRPVREITEDEVRAIYEEYWRDSQCHKIAVRHPKVALVHFDCAFNVGLFQANKLLQRALRVPADGIIGPITFTALDDVNDGAYIISSYLLQRAAFYRTLAERRPQMTQFLGSWLSRLRHCARATGVAIQPQFAKES